MMLRNNNFKFKPSKSIKSVTSYSGRLFNGLCVKDENNKFLMQINLKGKDGSEDSCLMLPINEDSLDIKNQEIVFSTTQFSKNGNPYVYYRTKQHSRDFPGLKDKQYTLLCNNWIYQGHIVKIDGKRYFSIIKPIEKYTELTQLESYTL